MNYYVLDYLLKKTTKEAFIGTVVNTSNHFPSFSSNTTQATFLSK